MPNSSSNFLGKGIKFPFQFSKTGRTGQNFSTSVSEGVEHVKECLYLLLHTSIGERVMLRDFGSKLARLVFEPQDQLLIQEILNAIKEAIRKWEKRVQVVDLKVLKINPKDGRIDLSFVFKIINTNVTGNMVFPFYINAAQSTMYSQGTVTAEVGL